MPVQEDELIVPGTGTDVGRVAHYRHEGDCVAAEILSMGDGRTATLRVFGPVDPEVRAGVKFDEAGKIDGTWHWPEV